MSSTQEKQEHKCHWRAYGQPDGTVVCDECNTAADVNKLIDSAKREGAEGERKKWNTAAEEALSILKETTKYVEQTTAQLEQSEESE